MVNCSGQEMCQNGDEKGSTSVNHGMDNSRNCDQATGDRILTTAYTLGYSKIRNDNVEWKYANKARI